MSKGKYRALLAAFPLSDWWVEFPLINRRSIRTASA